MSKIVAFYNHKGGVSKTTTTFNVAHLMAESGKRILVVDADPQCNMTELMMARIIQRLDQQAEEADQPNELPGTSLLSILKTRIDGDVPFINTSKVETVTIRENLDLIRGDVALNSIEDSLAEAHNQRFSGRIHEKRTYVAVGDLLTRIALERNYFAVFIDVGPSSGALTRTCFLACDGFFIPVAPDRFNVQAIGTLSSIMARWLEEHSRIVDDFRSLELPVRQGVPKFLGTVYQHFKIANNKPKPGFRLWMQRIPLAIQEKLLPVLTKYSSRVAATTPEILGEQQVHSIEIPDFGSLAPLMQEWGKPVFGISQSDTAAVTESGKPWSGNTWNDAEERMATYRSRIQQIANRIEILP